MATTTFLMSLAAATTSAASLTDSATVLFIFQLPAITILRMVFLDVVILQGMRTGPGPDRGPPAALLLGKGGDARQDLAFEVFERSAATGRTVRDLLVGAVFLGRGRRVAAADDGDRTGNGRLDDRVGHRPVPASNLANSKTPAGPFQMMVLAFRIASQ
jgi:hypothetical protein